MKRIAFYDTKSYDRDSFEAELAGSGCDYKMKYIESRLSPDSAILAKGCDAVCAFVNDEITAETIDELHGLGIGIIAMRCAGYSNVDLWAAAGKIKVVRVPAYSPHAVAEHAAGLLLALDRKLYKAYFRTRDFNFNIAGLCGTDLWGKTAGIIGTGKIGRCFIDICRGIGMKVLAYDPYPIPDGDIEYVSLDRLLCESDVISLHCPLTEDNYRLLDSAAFARMKRGVFIINTSRGALIDSTALLDALNDGRVRGAGLDVDEEEEDVFFEDHSERGVKDEVLALLISKPNVLITSHQAFLTEEALMGIAKTTIANLDAYFSGKDLKNEVRASREKVIL